MVGICYNFACNYRLPGKYHFRHLKDLFIIYTYFFFFFLIPTWAGKFVYNIQYTKYLLL